MKTPTMRNRVIQTVVQALETKKNVQVTFKNEAATQLLSLLAMIGRKEIDTKDDEHLKALQYANNHNRWYMERDRTVVLTFNDAFKNVWERFIELMGRPDMLEEVRIAA